MTEPEDPNALIGAVLNRRHRLTRVLGGGGLAVVYEAESLAGEPPCAIKLLRSEFCQETTVVERFLNEAAISQRVRHPGITTIYEAARAEDGTPYLVMELLNGQPLRLRMNRGRLPVDEAAPIGHEMLLALGAAHAANVVHRDLKPDNVFLSRDAAGLEVVKLLDFGIALVADAAGGLGRRTRTGILLGTPGYMSPEQVRNPKEADYRTDLWSVGVLLYEMLSGAPAFPAENDFARLTSVLYSDATPIQQVAPQYAHWNPFFQRALAREPAARFQSAQQMADALVSIARAGYMPGDAHAAPHAAAMPVLPAAQTAAPFVQTSTAVSAGAHATRASQELTAPLVHVVTPRRGGVPVVLVVVFVAFAVALGFTLGVIVSRAR